MEALSFGIPVIATDVGGAREVVKDRHNGLLLKKDFDVSELGRHICAFVNMTDEIYEQYRLNARTYWNNNYNSEANYRAFSAIINDLADEQGGV